MRLGSGWDQLYHTGLIPAVLKLAWNKGGIMQLYHTGLTPGVLNSAWDQGEINYVTLG